MNDTSAKAPNRRLVNLVVIGCFVAALSAGGALLWTDNSAQVAAFIDSQAATTDISTTTSSTLLLPAREVKILATHPEYSIFDSVVDLSGLAVGTCFDIVKPPQGGRVAEPRGCNSEHFYQLYAMGEVPSSVTEQSLVARYWLDFCASRFTGFVGVANVYSRFQFSGQYPSEREFPTVRVLSCYIFFPGEFGWIGSAKETGR